jgi:hypothetical protein
MQHRSNSTLYIHAPPSRSWHTGLEEFFDVADTCALSASISPRSTPTNPSASTKDAFNCAFSATNSSYEGCSDIGTPAILPEH